MSDTTHPSTRRAGAILLFGALVLFTPLRAEEPRDMMLGTLIPTDAIRIEVAPGRLDECAPIMAWAFNLPPESAGFGPFLPEVPVGYGPTCAVIPQASGLSFSMTARD